MNNTLGITKVTVAVPEAAVETLKNWAAFLCSELEKDAQAGWIISEPLPESDRPGRALRAARLRVDLTQQALAEKIGVPQAHISQYERNTRKIPLLKAKALAAILKTSEEYFLN